MARKRRKTTTKRRSPAVAVYARNPAPRKRRRRAVAASSRRVRRFRRNPSVRSMAGGFGKLSSLIMPAAAVGAGAVGAEVLMGYLPLPAALKTGVARHVTKGAVGLAAGLVLGKVLKQRKLGNLLAVGAITIATHDAIKELIVARAPGVKFGAYVPGDSLGYYSPGSLVDMSSPRGMGEYVPAFTGSLAGSDFQA